jgi:hypothetical protein
MDPSQRRCFLEVHTDEDEEPRLLQLEPNVKFHNVLARFDEEGDLYWQGQSLDPDATPASVGMPCGVDKANTLWFTPAASSYERPSATWTSQQTPLVESTAAMRSPLLSGVVAVSGDASPRQCRAPSLPAYFDGASVSSVANSTPPREARVAATATTVPIAISWYSRPRLLSPAPPPSALTANWQREASAPCVVWPPPPPKSVSPSSNTASPYTAQGPRNGPAPASTTLLPTQRQFQQQQPPCPPPPVAAAPPAVHDPHFHVLAASRSPHGGETRRNRPILIDPAVLVDDSLAGPVQLLRSELCRLQRDVAELKHLQVGEQRRSRDARRHHSASREDQVTPRRREAEVGRVVSSPSPIPALSTEPSVEELAMELHDKQMHRLYEQRRFYLTHGHVAS